MEEDLVLDEATDAATAGEDECWSVVWWADAQYVVIHAVEMVQYTHNIQIFLINHNLYKCFLGM